MDLNLLVDGTHKMDKNEEHAGPQKLKNFLNVLAELWVDLQSTNLPLARISGKDVNVNMFLMAMHFLKCYQTEKERSLLSFDMQETGPGSLLEKLQLCNLPRLCGLISGLIIQWS
jgi:hypothetical protein